MIYERLRALKEQKRPITLGATGTGWMAEGFAAALQNVPGMRLGAVAASEPARGKEMLLNFGGYEEDSVTEVSSAAEANEAFRRGWIPVCPTPEIMAAIDGLDLVTDVTPSPASGAETAYYAIESGKDVVLINIEADVTVGRALKRKAAEAGVLYSVSSGDEPGCLMELWDFVRILGYQPVIIGKGKNNPLDPDATPDSVRDSAKKADKNAFQVASYVDGTKTMFELTCVANATGCVPAKPGMTGPEADLSTVSDAFRLKSDGGWIEEPGIVDYVQGKAMAGGVFITVRVENDRVARDLTYLKVGKGPYFTFFRPYHLWFLEAPISLARAHLDRETTLVPLDRPVAEVATIAKRDLAPGVVLDDFGGYTFRGLNYSANDFGAAQALPVGMAPGARMRNAVVKGAIVRWSDVEVDENAILTKLRREQDVRDGFLHPGVEKPVGRSGSARYGGVQNIEIEEFEG